MRRFCFSLLFLTFVTATLTDVLPAQYGYEACVVVLKGQNRNRKVAGHINEECGSPVEPLGWLSDLGIPLEHDPPFGNWGVNSNYGPVYDGDQFKGWKPKGRHHQWNSCTTEEPEFREPNCQYYRPSKSAPYRCDQQYSDDIVTHGILKYRYSSRPCPPPWWPTQPSDFSGCRGTKTVGQSNNFMTLYELDGKIRSIRFDGDDLIETLYFPGTSVTLTNCTKEGCPEKTSSWVRMTSSTDSTKIIEAELRMKASAYYEACDWSWTGGGG